MANQYQYNNYESYHRRTRKKKRGSIWVWIQLLLSAAVVAVLYMIDMLPLEQLIVVGAVLLIFFLLNLGLCNATRSRSGGRVLAVIISLLLGVALGYLIKTYSVLDRIAGADTKTDEMSVLVLVDDPAQSIGDTAGYIYGTASVDQTNADKLMDEIGKELGEKPIATSFSSYAEAVNALMNGEVGAITFNEAYRQILKEMYPDFNEQTRVLYNKSIKSKVNVTKGNRKVTRETFIVYISGIDVYGDISQTSRSDVNILASVNPVTHKVQLISTPRDSYVELPDYADYDKLTHAGIYGVSESIRALEELYDVKIDYYVRVNFTGFEEIVDALGGITVDAEEGFTAWDGTWFDAGENQLDGARALSFARERKAFEDGDFQRGRNQMKVIKAIAEKAMSPAILPNYGNVLDSAADSLETSMSRSEIGELVRMQLSSGDDWDIESYVVTGYVDSRNTYSYGAAPLSVVILDESAIAEAKLLLQENEN